MYVSLSCYIVQRFFFKFYVTDDDVGNIETCPQNQNCRNVLKNHNLVRYSEELHGDHNTLVLLEVKIHKEVGGGGAALSPLVDMDSKSI